MKKLTHYNAKVRFTGAFYTVRKTALFGPRHRSYWFPLNRGTARQDNQAGTLAPVYNINYMMMHNLKKKKG